MLFAVVAFLVSRSWASHSAGVDDYVFVGQSGGCPSATPPYALVLSSEHIGRNLVSTCVQDNDGNASNNDLVVAIGSLSGACPPSHSVEKRSSEHIGLNNIKTCGKDSGPVPAIALGQYDSGGGVCPTQAGATLAGTFTPPSEHIGLNNITTCLYAIAPLSVSLSANPNSGPAPLNNVDLIASVSNAAASDITYKFDCTNNGTFELTITTATNPYTANDLCDYSANGSYTAKVEATQGSTVSATAAITVSKPPKIKEVIP